jgi:hypothetical protein
MENHAPRAFGNMTSTPPPNPQLPPSPGSDTTPPIHTPVPSWTPPEIPYNESFEDDVMNAILHPPPPDPEPGESEISLNFDVTPDDLPLQLHDFRRKYPSAVPGILLPTRDSSLHGACGVPDAVAHGLAREMIEQNGIKTPAEFAAFLEEELRGQKRVLKERMERRQESMKHNEVLDKEIRQLEMERDMQRRVAEKWRQGRRGSDG